ncbi:ABC-type branched-subunit amino acid transport system substrate-binding protein [Bradyrhizobium sp. GM6.1]
MHAQAIKLADVAELSGGGATVGTNWKNGIDLAIEEINAKGGVLGRKLEVTHADSQSNPGVARAQVQKALDAEPYVLLGPGYSGSVKVTAPLAAEAGIAQIMGGEAAELTQGGNKFLFRTSFGQQSSMPKVAKYIHDDMKAKSVAVVWVNNDFGRGAAAMSSSRSSTVSAPRSSPISPPRRARPISPPTSARSRPPIPTPYSSI